MNPIHTHRTLNREFRFLMSPLVFHAVQEIEPDVLFGGPLVGGYYFFEGGVDAWVADFHGLDGVGGEGYAGADFTEVRGCFVDCYFYVAFVEGDAEGESCYSAAGDCVGGFCGGHVDGRFELLVNQMFENGSEVWIWYYWYLMELELENRRDYVRNHVLT